MNSISFPKMFSSNSTNIEEGLDATQTCLQLLLQSEQGDMFGDPEFGVKLQKYKYNQNNNVLKDIIIDEIYDKVSIFCPQIMLTRNDITLVQKGTSVYIYLKGTNKVDYTTNMYELELFNTEER